MQLQCNTGTVLVQGKREGGGGGGGQNKTLIRVPAAVLWKEGRREGGGGCEGCLQVTLHATDVRGQESPQACEGGAGGRRDEAGSPAA